jgi:hypothetical protein
MRARLDEATAIAQAASEHPRGLGETADGEHWQWVTNDGSRVVEPRFGSNGVAVTRAELRVQLLYFI